MISDKYISETLLPKIKKNYRLLDYLLIERIVRNNDNELVNELKKFQNADKGFGNGLEPDIQMPQSSVAATDIAINILEDIKDENVKQNLIKDIVSYFESVYNIEKECFFMVTKEVNEYPRAIWWNYDEKETCNYGNPNPEIYGFLYQNRKYLTKLDVNHLITQMVSYIHNGFEKDADMHSILSVLRFYKRVDSDVKNLIRDKLQKVINDNLEREPSKWSDYTLEPYMVAIIEKGFLSSNLDLLKVNLDYNLELIMNDLLLPKWEWYQFNDVFDKVKYHWLGIINQDVIKALRINRK